MATRFAASWYHYLRACGLSQTQAAHRALLFTSPDFAAWQAGDGADVITIVGSVNGYSVPRARGRRVLLLSAIRNFERTPTMTAADRRWHEASGRALHVIFGRSDAMSLPAAAAHLYALGWGEECSGLSFPREVVEIFEHVRKTGEFPALPK